jgi:hypothetical protein
VPFRSGERYKKSLIFTLAALMSIFFIAAGIIGHTNYGFMSRINSDVFEKTPDMTSFEDQVRDCWLIVERTPTVSSSCILGNTASPVLFGLLGDSHAGSLLNVLREEANRLDIQGRNFSYRNCPPLSRAKPVSQEAGDLACYDLRKDFFRVAEISPSNLPKHMIINARWSLLMERDRFNNGEGGIESGNAWLWELPLPNINYSEAMRSEIIESIQKILSADKTVFLIYPVPEMGWDVSRILSRHLLVNGVVSLDVASVSYKRFLERNKSAIEALDAIVGGENLVRIRPDKVLCNTYLRDRCVAHIDGQALYFDNNHLNNKGAELVLKEVIYKLSNQRH